MTYEGYIHRILYLPDLPFSKYRPSVYSQGKDDTDKRLARWYLPCQGIYLQSSSPPSLHIEHRRIQVLPTVHQKIHVEITKSLSPYVLHPRLNSTVSVPVDNPETSPRIQQDTHKTRFLPHQQIIIAGIDRAVASSGRQHACRHWRHDIVAVRGRESRTRCPNATALVRDASALAGRLR